MPIYSTLTRSINQDSPVSYVSTTTPEPFLLVKTQITSTTMLSHRVSIFVRPHLAYHRLILTCNKKFILCIPCWLGVWFIGCSVYVFFFLCSWLLSFVFQVLLLVMLWIRFCWLTLSRPVCSIDMEEEKGIVLLGHSRCYPLDLSFFGRFEKSCFDLKWRLDVWVVVWSRLLLPEDLALCFFNPSYLMARDPEVLVSKASPCVTRVTLIIFSMYQSPFMMSQFTDGIVCSSFRFFSGYFVLWVFTQFYV